MSRRHGRQRWRLIPMLMRSPVFARKVPTINELGIPLGTVLKLLPQVDRALGWRTET